MGQRELVEEPGSLSAENRRLFVRLYRPPETARRRVPVVLVPADGEERTWSQRAMVNLARFLARQGHPVVKFDFRGQGESDGSFEETDVPSRMQDLDRVLERARSVSGVWPAVVALRLGANVAARVLESRPGLRFVAVEPVESLDAYVNDLLRKNVSSQFIVNKKVVANRKQLRARIASGTPVSCSGFLLSRIFLESLRELRPSREWRLDPEPRVLRVSMGTEGDGDRVEGVPAFWMDAPTFRSHPTALFEAIASALGPEAEASGVADANATWATPSGDPHAVDIDGPLGALAATWSGGERERPCFLFLNPGPNDRSGPHGMYVRLGALLHDAGCSVLRIDAHGVGESDGADADLQGKPIPEVHYEINTGAQVPSALAALSWLRERGHSNLAVVGLCGGAVTGLLAAAQTRAWDARLLLLGTPVIHQGVGEDLVLPGETVRSQFKGMVTKLANPAYWLRLLTFRSDFAVHWRILRERAVLLFRKRRSAVGRGGASTLHPRTNHQLLDAWERFSRAGGRTTFIFSENDYLWALFKEHFAPLARGEGLPAGTDVVVLKNATHNVTDRAAEKDLESHLLSVAESMRRVP